MNALKTLTLSLALVLGAAAPAVFAQPMMDHGGHGMHRGMGGPGMDGQRLLHMLDDSRHAGVGPQTVLLAVRIARHRQAGPHNAALQDDFEALGRLLNIPAHAAQRLAGEVA